MTVSLVLASGSAARRMLLINAGLQFAVEGAQINEREVEEALPPTQRGPEDVALHLAIAKARDVSERHPDAIVIGCDQTMSLGERIFHKAKDVSEAREILLSLRAAAHHLNSAVCLVRNDEVLWSHVGVASMHVRAFSEQFLDAYLDQAGDKILSSVGCYQLEGEGVQLFDKIEGDYFTVLGLPLLPLLDALRKLGVNHE
ncbi:Maf-like protein [Rhizobium sp. AAP43]|uniref:Maf-like protein n=1 Tax=Rhizobium sp. AAP43 TaxID=1523420 RepID=UPI0006B9D28D|nr:Maf-like protein [Rhizobium sp. AAP43]KPF42892.1 septum formation inhibitor Maf [Rhizobium sp. AAP43]